MLSLEPDLKRLRSGTTSRTNLSPERIAKHAIKEPHLYSDPKQYHRNLVRKQTEKAQNLLILSLTCLSNETDRLSTFAAELSMPNVHSWTKETENNLVSIFQLLHKPLIQEYDIGDDNLSAFVDPSIPMNMKEKICSLLHRCIHALATQNLIYQEPNDSIAFRTQRASTFAATDIIRTSKTRQHGKLQKFMTRQLVAFGAHQGLWKVANRFNICISLDTNRRMAIADVNAAMTKGITMDRHDLLLLLYDNIGFREKHGYQQFTALQWIRIEKEKLREWRLYPKEGETDDSVAFSEGSYSGKTFSQLRDKSHNWDIDCHETSFDDVLGFNDDDHKALGESVFKLIDTMLCNFEYFPTYVEATEIISRVETKKRWKKKYNKKYSAAQDASVSLGDTFEALEINEEDIARHSYDSIYEASGSSIDKPIQADLNKASTCQMLLNYGMSTREQQLELKAEEDWEDIRSLVDDIPLFVLGDGNPTEIMTRIIREQQYHARYYGKVKPFTGGFHFGLEGHRKRGYAFGKSLLEDVFSCWRETEGQLNWVLNPGDPNQINTELVMYILGMYAAAIRSILDTDTSDTRKIEISSRKVADHMLERARRWPIIMVALLEMRFAHLIFMLNESEETNDCNLYITVQKYFVRLFASTHCTKYVSMITDFFVDWYCFSPAERILFANAVFTRKTINGKSVFTVSSNNHFYFELYAIV